MSIRNRQSTLFPAESWRRQYESDSNVDFSAYTQSELKETIRDYVSRTYPEEYNDWIGSSEFVILLDILSNLTQSVSYRVDLSARENFFDTAERRSSLIRLAQNLSYKVSRVTPATGEGKLIAIRTTQDLTDSDGNTINTVYWNDSTDPDWLEKWLIVMNAAMSNRTQYGRPLRYYSDGLEKVGLYRFNSLAPATGSYRFNTTVSGSSLPFEIINVLLDSDTGLYEELAPSVGNAMHLLYREDGLGNSSGGTGWFLPIRQGEMGYQDILFEESKSMREVNINVPNINNIDVWVTEVNDDGTVVSEWTRVDATFGEGLGFTTSTQTEIFEVETRENDQITVRFGDGKFGNIPIGKFRIWYRTSTDDPKIVKTSDINEKKISLPYANGGSQFNLSLTFSLQEAMTNAAEGETDDEIRSRAPKMYYSQDRMITSEDYNSLLLEDISILKVNAVNRTFSGHGISGPLKDPTGTYNSLKLIGEDGRVFRRFIGTTTVLTAGLSAEDILNDYIQPAIRTTDKEELYNGIYEEVRVLDYTTFTVDSTVNNRARGRFQRGEVGNEYNVAVGTSASSDDPMKHVRDGAVVRWTSYDGSTERIDYTVNGGLVSNGILFSDPVTEGSVVWSVFPGFRVEMTETEKQNVTARIELKRSFAIRWDIDTETWSIVKPEDIDESSDFNLNYAGNTTSAGLDASWMVRLEYSPEAGQDRWIVHERGLGVYFVSDREVDLYGADPETVIDAETGRSLRDNVKILKDNESRDSLVRRGFQPAFGWDPVSGAIEAVGDGTTIEFSLLGETINEDHIIVTNIATQEVYPKANWSINNKPGIDSIEFNTAPSIGERYLVRYDPNVARLKVSRHEVTGDDSSTDFNFVTLGALHTDNVWAFEDGLIKSPGRDYFITAQENNTAGRIEFTSGTPGAGVELDILNFGGSGPAFIHRHFESDGIIKVFTTLTNSDKVWVFVNGELQTSGWSLDKTTPTNYVVTFLAAPDDGDTVDIKILMWPTMWKVSESTQAAAVSQDSFTVPGDTSSDAQVLFFVDGVETRTTIEGGLSLPFSPMSGGETIHMINFEEGGAPASGSSYSLEKTMKTNHDYIGTDTTVWITGPLRQDDGYVDENGVAITGADADRDLESDTPFFFRDLVIQDGSTDLVLWRKITSLGRELWEPVSETTLPMATYDNAVYQNAVGDSIGARTNGDIHRTSAGVYLTANGTTGLWETAADQTIYRYDVGRTGLRFLWTHYSGDTSRIDPSRSNVIDVYVLTRTYDEEFRDWLSLGTGDEPDPPTLTALRNAYGTFDTKKAASDALIFRPAKYKVLFGTQAVAELQADIVVVKVPGSTVPDADLKLRVLQAIDDYFDPTLWDFGETLYYTELAGYVHQELSQDVASIVIVPKESDAKFGRLFQVTSQPDELFISGAQPENVEIVDSLSDSRLRIG